ncbi:MAG: alpha/beta hydrolase [Planctomycetes bacterium]|nr:alpha/beta hydrolase [Planctomycetota bacterium]
MIRGGRAPAFVLALLLAGRGARAMIRGGRAPAFVLALLLAGLDAGCLAPPVIVPPLRTLAVDPVEGYPAGTRTVSLPAGEGALLCGLFVPADPGAPVVLHLLESGASAGESSGRSLLAEELADLGFASLIVDYTGVGLSTGERGAKHLERDARAAFDEAVRRAGAPERVVLRGTSIGTLAAATLLRDGARPMAVVLVAPVRADTVVARAAESFHGTLAGWFAHLAFRRVADVDLTAELARVRMPLFVAGSRRDEFVGEEHTARFERSVRAAGGTWFGPQDSGHITLAALGHRLLPGELDFLRSAHVPPLEPRRAELLASVPDALRARIPLGSEARARLEELARFVRPGRPELDVAAVLVSRDAADAARRRKVFLDSRHQDDVDALTALLDLEDSAGAFDWERVETMLVVFAGLRTTLQGVRQPRIDALLASAGEDEVQLGVLGALDGTNVNATVAVQMRRLEACVSEPGMDAETLRRRAFRLLCKLLDVPERPLPGSDSTFEVLERGCWVEKRYPAPKDEVVPRKD